jgi:uncharacterized surface protein with fasciclin (FAS1) repeats
MPGERQEPHGQAPIDILREALVATAGIQADNGVIDVIDAVLVPQDLLKTLEQQRQG